MNSRDSENTKWIADRDQSKDSVFFIVCAAERISWVRALTYSGGVAPSALPPWTLILETRQRPFVRLGCRIHGDAPRGAGERRWFLSSLPASPPSSPRSSGRPHPILSPNAFFPSSPPPGRVCCPGSSGPAANTIPSNSTRPADSGLSALQEGPLSPGPHSTAGPSVPRSWQAAGEVLSRRPLRRAQHEPSRDDGGPGPTREEAEPRRSGWGWVAGSAHHRAGATAEAPPASAVGGEALTGSEGTSSWA